MDIFARSELLLGSEAMERLEKAIYEAKSQADYILVNTCGFIEAAKEESINAILSQLLPFQTPI